MAFIDPNKPDAIVEAFQDEPTLDNFIALLHLYRAQGPERGKENVWAVFGDDLEYEVTGIHREASVLWIELTTPSYVAV